MELILYDKYADYKNSLYNMCGKYIIKKIINQLSSGKNICIIELSGLSTSYCFPLNILLVFKKQLSIYSGYFYHVEYDKYDFVYFMDFNQSGMSHLTPIIDNGIYVGRINYSKNNRNISELLYISDFIKNNNLSKIVYLKTIKTPKLRKK